ncbi:uncharacterized protein KIAA0825 homolog isoform X1 [Schistocerca cancellata]|uniref:uncharacterized protein KIAA0825 homolog isoform X1 n=1 Tax=Schistocerca cancellata TaxID=274614 RepID=UPI002119A666|nr:uncharacterized protein KIAA0825 homolog isoform X1 [Schistocerca cancellata]
MEIMEDGNLMDRVRILLQRDLAYYQDHQTVLQENLCPGVVGGLLDFPHYSSFAAVKLIIWWEEAYVAAYQRPSGLLGNVVSEDNGNNEDDRGCGGVATTSSPQEFLSVVTSSAGQMLEHLHTLSQEALDHADLTVLTGTLGAAAVIKNCLWCYNEQLKKRAEETGSPKSDDKVTLYNSYRRYHDMSEALAERLLDLHCRLLSLYVLQDADCLNWEDKHLFFEGERGSFVIQMWWLYIQGTKESLWNTVPPKTAQRVLAGMVNESLSILTVRYTQAKTSSERSTLLINDVSNLLLCISKILPAVCNDASELLAHSLQNNVVKDIHAKCHELLKCLIIRGCPLEVLYRVFRKGLSGVQIFQIKDAQSPATWFIFAVPHLFTLNKGKQCLPLDAASIALELIVLVAQPQASWSLILKVLLMCHGKITSIIMDHFVNHIGRYEYKAREPRIKCTNGTENKEKVKRSSIGHCNGFLCYGKGECLLWNETEGSLPPNIILESLMYITCMAGASLDLKFTILPILEKTVKDWAGCLDKQQIWNQNRPPWVQALLRPLESLVFPITQTLICAVKDGASTDQAMILALDCVGQIVECVPPHLLCAAALIEEMVPADVQPMAGSVSLQLILSALYSQLQQHSGSSMALSEALCDLGQNTKQTEKIQALVVKINDARTDAEDFMSVEDTPHMADMLASNLLLTEEGPHYLKVMWQFLQFSSHWLLGQLGMLEPGESAPQSPPIIPAIASRPTPVCLLHTMFHVGHRPFDQLLTGDWNIDWNSLLQTSLNITPDSLWAQLVLRPEFQDSPLDLSQHDAAVTAALKAIFQQFSNTS